MIKHNEKIENEIITIINTLRDSGKSPLSYDDVDKNLFGKELMSEAYEIVGVFCEIEEKYNIGIKESELEKYGFNTVSNISRIVEACIEAKS